MSASTGPKVAIITGAERGIGAGLVTAFRGAGYAVVGTSRSIPASDESDFMTVQGDITEAETAQLVIDRALDRFGRVDSLINNAGVYVAKGFTDYTPEDYTTCSGQSRRILSHHPARRPEMLTQGSGHVVKIRRRSPTNPTTACPRRSPH